jgi:hypothetical protein
VKYINARPEQFGMNIKYSTPSEYIKTINAMNVTFVEKTDDFFPYADTEYGYWTGYFTSRLNLKHYIRQTGRYLQSMRTLFGMLAFEGTNPYVA